MKRLLVLAVLLLPLGLLALASPPDVPVAVFVHAEAAPPSPEGLKAASVIVAAAGGSGSGVVVKNGEYDFVWTDGHVVEGNEHAEKGVDPATGLERRYVRYEDVKVGQEHYEGGRKVGETFYLAEILRYSDPSKGEDIALLRVWKKKAFPAGAHFEKDAPVAGTPVWHVGSMAGRVGVNSFSTGVVSASGRLRRAFRPEETDDGHIYDQVTSTAIPGSSGGGVFDARTGLCLGLVTEGYAPTVVFITPARRLWAFARRTDCLWALDEGVAVPAEEELHRQAVRDKPLPAPEPAPAPAKMPHGFLRGVLDFFGLG